MAPRNDTNFGIGTLGPALAEDGRGRLIDLPVEEIVIAGPCVDFCAADFACESAGMPRRMLLLRCGVTEPALGAFKKFSGPDAACHGGDDATLGANDPARFAAVVNDLLPGQKKPAKCPIIFLNPRTRGSAA